MSEMTLPEGWVETTLGELVEVIRGITYNKNQSSSIETEGMLPVLRANNIQNGELLFDDLVYVQSTLIKDQQYIKVGDIVVAMSSGSKALVGKTAQAKNDFNGGFGAFCGVLRPKPELNNKLIYWFTCSSDYRNKISELSAGANINNLKPTSFNSIYFPLPPLAEQKGIADQLDTLLAQVERTKARLESVPDILKQLRQSVLAAAVSGKLTNKISDWRYDVLKNCFECIDGDRGSNYPKKEDYLNEGYCLFLSTKNVRSFGFDFREKVFISKDKDKTLRKGRLERGDLVITTRGTLGYVASYDESVPFDVIRINSGMLILRKKDKEFVNDYFKILVASPYFQKQIEKQSTGSAQPQLPANILKDFLLPIPTYLEQTEIVRRVETLFAHADKIEQQAQAGLARVNQLTQSILAKAFRGELTAQWRKDNPELISGENSAEALLVKIAQERGKVDTKLKTSRQSKKDQQND